MPKPVVIRWSRKLLPRKQTNLPRRKAQKERRTRRRLRRTWKRLIDLGFCSHRDCLPSLLCGIHAFVHQVPEQVEPKHAEAKVWHEEVVHVWHFCEHFFHGELVGTDGFWLCSTHLLHIPIIPDLWLQRTTSEPWDAHGFSITFTGRHQMASAFMRKACRAAALMIVLPAVFPSSVPWPFGGACHSFSQKQRWGLGWIHCQKLQRMVSNTSARWPLQMRTLHLVCIVYFQMVVWLCPSNEACCVPLFWLTCVCVVFHAHLKGCGYVSHRPEEPFPVWVFDRFLVSLGQHWCCVGLFDFTHAAVMWKTDHKNHNWVEEIERPQCFSMALTFIRCLWAEWPEANNGSSRRWYAGCTHGEKECQSSFFALP